MIVLAANSMRYGRGHLDLDSDAGNHVLQVCSSVVDVVHRECSRLAY